MTLKLDRYRIALALILLGGALLTGASAGALFDFEQPYFIEDPEVRVKDHAVVKHEGVYHVFYIQSFPPLPGEWMRQEKWLGHITSEDLCHWTRHDSILHVVSNTWENKLIWAPEVIEDPESDGWLMYYTGANLYIVQQTGGAKSADLFTWSRFPENPIYYPGEWAFWFIENEGWPWSNCRDPEIFHIPGEHEYYMLNTTRMEDLTGSVSLAVSTDLVNWADAGPFYVHDSENMIESVQLLQDESDTYHFFFTEENVTGTSHMLSNTMMGNWDLAGRRILDPGHGAEVSDLGDEVVFSRYNGVDTVNDVTLSYLRFDGMDLDTDNHIPQIIRRDGLLGHWDVWFGNAFDNQPTWGDNPLQRGEVSSNMEGNSYLATFEDFPEPQDSSTGTVIGTNTWGVLRSEPFVVGDNRIGLLVGGGQLPDTCFVALVDAASEEVRFIETGTGSFAMDAHLWNTESLAGQTVFLAIADLHLGDGGHISVDSIREYEETGEDPFPPSEPSFGGPTLTDLLVAAGFDPTGTAGAPIGPRGRLMNPYPNPFNPATRLSYMLPEAGELELVIHDVRGRLVRRLISGRREAGRGEATWDGLSDAGRSQPSGFYFARLILDGETVDSQRLALVK